MKSKSAPTMITTPSSSNVPPSSSSTHAPIVMSMVSSSSLSSSPSVAGPDPDHDTDTDPDALRAVPPPKTTKSIKKRIKRIFTRSKQRRNSTSYSNLLGDKSIQSLGTIDLDNNNEDFDLNDDGCGFGLYAYDDIDRFHNARCSTHSSYFSLDTARFHRSLSFNELSLDYSTTVATASATATATATASGDAAEKILFDDQDKAPDTTSSRNEKNESSDSPCHFLTKKVAPQDPNLEMELVSHRLSNLYRDGKEQFKNGCYNTAWKIQTKALSILVSSHWKEHQEQDQGQLDNDQRQDAMIRYELAKIKYHQAREQTNPLSPTSDTDASPSYHVHLSDLHDELKNARCKLALKNYQYYTSQLHHVEESTDRSDTNQIYNKLYILHNLGTLCEKDLHRYKEALGYYTHALRIEEMVLRAYTEAELESKANMENDDNTLEGDGDDGVGVSAYVKDFAQRIRCTRRKIGRLQHTCLGRFDLALLSTISS